MSAPDLGADLIEGMIWDPNADTLTFVYQAFQENSLTEYAHLTHALDADADATVTPLFINGTADAIYLQQNDAEALCVTVIWNEQVMHLTVFGDDAAGWQNLISSREQTEDIISMLSHIRIPKIGENEPSEYLVCTDADVRTVECSFSVGGNTTAVITYDLRTPEEQCAVIGVYRERVTDGTWLEIGDGLFCTVMDGMYLTLKLTEFSDFTIENLTFSETIAERTKTNKE